MAFVQRSAACRRQWSDVSSLSAWPPHSSLRHSRPYVVTPVWTA